MDELDFNRRRAAEEREKAMRAAPVLRSYHAQMAAMFDERAEASGKRSRSLLQLRYGRS